MSEGGKVRVAPLFLGLTRPPMLLGVTYMYVALEFIIAMVGFIATSQFRWFAMVIPFHLLGYYLSSKEPLFINLYSIKSQKCTNRLNSFRHGGNSYDQGA